MIEAEMYGMIPRANTETFRRPPPENMSNRQTGCLPRFQRSGRGPPVDARNRDMHPDPVRAEKAQRPEQLCTQFRRTGKVIRTTKSHESPTLPLPVL